MAKSLIEELPRIASEGRQEAQRIIERLSSGTRIGLQTNELVLPRKDVSGFFRGQVPNIPNAFNAALDEGSWMNRLVYGDNLLTMQALLAGDPQTGLPSLRGKVDLIYIDPPFDSKADYRTAITLPHMKFSQKPTVIEQFAYADTVTVDKIIQVKDKEAFDMMHSLAKKEGLLVGISSGAAVSAAVKLASNDSYKGKRIIVLLPDTGERYLSMNI